MARRHYFWDSSKQDWVDIQKRKRAPRGPVLIGDYQPYRNMLNGQIIDGRSAHREFLARTGVRNVEPGETSKPDLIDRESLRKDIGTAYNMVKEGYRPDPCETVTEFKESLGG